MEADRLALLVRAARQPLPAEPDDTPPPRRRPRRPRQATNPPLPVGPTVAASSKRRRRLRRHAAAPPTLADLRLGVAPGNRLHVLPAKRLVVTASGQPVLGGMELVEQLLAAQDARRTRRRKTAPRGARRAAAGRRG